MKTASKFFLVISIVCAFIMLFVGITLFVVNPANNASTNVVSSTGPSSSSNGGGIYAYGQEPPTFGELLANDLGDAYVPLALFLCFYPPIVIIIAFASIRALDKARSYSDIVGWGMASFLFCGVLPGILMLCIKEEDLKASETVEYDDQPEEDIENEKEGAEDSYRSAPKSELESKLDDLKRLHDIGKITDEEYEKARQHVLFD